MYTKDEIVKAHTSKFKGTMPNHAIMSAEHLESLSRALDKENIEYKLDQNWPWHLLVKKNGYLVSLYNGGWHGGIEIQVLNPDGQPNSKFKEHSYSTSRGVIGYLLKLKG